MSDWHALFFKFNSAVIPVIRRLDFPRMRASDEKPSVSIIRSPTRHNLHDELRRNSRREFVVVENRACFDIETNYRARCFSGCLISAAISPWPRMPVQLGSGRRGTFRSAALIRSRGAGPRSWSAAPPSSRCYEAGLPDPCGGSRADRRTWPNHAQLGDPEAAERAAKASAPVGGPTSTLPQSFELRMRQAGDDALSHELLLRSNAATASPRTRPADQGTANQAGAANREPGRCHEPGQCHELGRCHTTVTEHADCRAW